MVPFRRHLIALSMVGWIGVSGCSSLPTSGYKPNPSDPKSLQNLKSMATTSLADAVAEEMDEGSRLSAIRDVGLKSGRQAGIKWRNKKINKRIANLNRELSIAFNFEQVLIAGSYLPPRVDILEGEVRKNSNGSISIIRQGFRIATEPKLVTSPPSHLNYLYRLPIPELSVNKLGIPRADNQAELMAWEQAVNEGWKIGIRHADISFIEDVNLLHRDFGGILRYIELANKGIIALPDIEKKDRGIVMSSNGRILNVGDEVISINSSPLFQSTAKWKALSDALTLDNQGTTSYE